MNVRLKQISIRIIPLGTHRGPNNESKVILHHEAEPLLTQRFLPAKIWLSPIKIIKFTKKDWEQRTSDSSNANLPIFNIGVGRGGARPPPIIWEGGPTYPLAPPIIHPPFQFLCEAGKNHKCTKLKGKIIINVTLI